jgi:excisionase family DNA binding protein
MTNDWLTVPEIAEQMKVSENTVHRWTEEHDPDLRLQAYQIKGIIRIKRIDLQDFLTRHVRKS